MDIPKGMTHPVLEQEKPRKVVTLADGNYVGAIHQALSILPVEVRVDRCNVLEEYGQAPKVELTLTITGEKEMDESSSQ